MWLHLRQVLRPVAVISAAPLNVLHNRADPNRAKSQVLKWEKKVIKILLFSNISFSYLYVVQLVYDPPEVSSAVALEVLALLPWVSSPHAEPVRQELVDGPSTPLVRRAAGGQRGCRQQEEKQQNIPQVGHLLSRISAMQVVETDTSGTRSSLRHMSVIYSVCPVFQWLSPWWYEGYAILVDRFLPACTTNALSSFLQLPPQLTIDESATYGKEKDLCCQGRTRGKGGDEDESWAREERETNGEIRKPSL